MNTYSMSPPKQGLEFILVFDDQEDNIERDVKYFLRSGVVGRRKERICIARISRQRATGEERARLSVQAASSLACFSSNKDAVFLSVSWGIEKDETDSERLLERCFVSAFHKGITVTAGSSFYQPGAIGSYCVYFPEEWSSFLVSKKYHRSDLDTAANAHYLFLDHDRWREDSRFGGFTTRQQICHTMGNAVCKLARISLQGPLGLLTKHSSTLLVEPAINSLFMCCLIQKVREWFPQKFNKIVCVGLSSVFHGSLLAFALGCSCVVASVRLGTVTAHPSAHEESTASRIFTVERSGHVAGRVDLPKGDMTDTDNVLVWSDTFQSQSMVDACSSAVKECGSQVVGTTALYFSNANIDGVMVVI